jgi:membrane protease YdiL (CAAX protease family)
MNNGDFRWTPLLATVGVAAGLWFVTFYLTWGNFWIKISLSALTLALLSILLKPEKTKPIHFDGKAVLIGFLSAIVLYLIFWASQKISTQIFPFAERQIGGIYVKGEGTPIWTIALLLFFVTGPSEELYWRGYLQDQLMRRLGAWQGWLLAAVLYAAVHLWATNFMLFSAAGVAGLFWGLVYWRVGNLAPVILSHSLWSAVIFAVLPLS